MAGRRSGLSVSSTCGICGYSACVCYKAAAEDAPDEYAPFGIYLNGIGGTFTSALGYGDPTGKFRSEVDGLQAGVNYLDTFDNSTELTPLNRLRLKSLNKLRELEGRNRCSRGQIQQEYSSPLRMTDLGDATTKQSATLFCPWKFPSTSREAQTPESTGIIDFVDDCVYEGHVSITVIGIGHSVWAVYGVGVTYFNTTQDSVDAYHQQKGMRRGGADPLGCGYIDGDLPIWPPREFFSEVLEIRIQDIVREWGGIVRRMQMEIKQFGKSHFSLKSGDQKTGHNKRRGTTTWISDIMESLRDLEGTLSRYDQVWELFSHQAIDCFTDAEPSAPSAKLNNSPDSVHHKYDFNFGDYANPDELFPDGIDPVLLDSNDNTWKFTFDFTGNELDWPELQCGYDSAPSAAPKHSKSEPSLATREATLEEPSATTMKVPQKSQWETLQELRLSSAAHYMKFLRLTANYDSRGIRMLRRMYGNSKGMLDTGITTFGDVIDGNKPQSLKEIFAFTCLSYVISKLLQKHGRMEGSHFLADIDRWRLAIKKEKDRLIYDQAVKIVWPEIDFLKEHSKEKDVTLTPPTPVSYKGNGTSLGNVFTATTQRLYVPSSMLAYGMTTSLDFNFLERARAMDCSNIGQDICSGLQAPSHNLDPDIQPRDHGFHDHHVGLLHETSTHEKFGFANFLNIYDPPLENNPSPSFDEVQPNITLNTYPPVCPPQIFQANEAVGRVNTKELGNYSPPIAPSDALVQTDLLQPEANGVPIVDSLLGCLTKTAMFQVVVEFVKFVTSLGDLLFRLSGSGISSRRRKAEVECRNRPVQDFSQFVAEAEKFVLGPIRKDLGEIDEPIDAVLYMADKFVRIGCLQTVREIEEYIITTARYLAYDYTSFIALVSKTLKRCLSASDRMTWDYIYPYYTANHEDYSATYIKKIETTEIEWALQNLDQKDDKNKGCSMINVVQGAELMNRRCGSNSSSNSDSSPLKKQRLSPPSPNSSNEHQSSATPPSSSSSDLPPLSKAYCHYANCKKSYGGRDARVNLRRHIRTVHEECKRIQCPKCTHESSRRDNVRKHFILKHKGEDVPALLLCKTRA